VTIWALLSLVVLLTALAVAVNSAWLLTGQLQLQTAGDAAALAGAATLINDEWLRPSSPRAAGLITSARAAAQQFAAANPVLTQPPQLDANAANLPDGDIVIGALDSNGILVPYGNLGNPQQRTLNNISAMVVRARRLRSRNQGVPLLLGALVLQPVADLQAQSVTVVDRDVYGFRPFPDGSIPVVPLMIRSDPTAADPQSWENQIIQRNGPDQDAYTPGQGFASGADGIHEMQLQLQLQPSGDPTQSNVYLLQIGADNPGSQVAAGVSASDLQMLGGQLALDRSTNQLILPATALGPTVNSTNYNAIRNGLRALQQSGEARVWPLGRFDSTTSEAVVTSFVAARVAAITENSGGPLQVTVQAAMRSTPQALTDPGRRSSTYLLPSPYVARARLVR
jgi:hypothetical protein